MKESLGSQRAAGLPQTESRDLKQLQGLYKKLEVFSFLIRGEPTSQMSQTGH